MSRLAPLCADDPLCACLGMVFLPFDEGGQERGIPVLYSTLMLLGVLVIVNFPLTPQAPVWGAIPRGWPV